MKENRIHNIAHIAPEFPCFLWNRERRAWLFATNDSVFLPGWQEIYSHWHESDGDFSRFPTDEPTKETTS